MKKINKSFPPNALTQFAEDNPNGGWESDFREHDAGRSYQSIRQIMVDTQGGLCGYCEREIKNLPKHQQRVEHYHNKSDKTNPDINWALDWNNVFAVCMGGSYQSIEEKEQYPLPKNLSCDAHKDHLVKKKKLSEACEGFFLNPLRIIATPCLFDFDRSNGKLVANPEACQGLAEIDNQYASLEELVEKTIDILNLNCDRVCTDRLLVLKSYNQAIASAIKLNDKQIFSKLAERWFRNKWPSYFTTRRILLGRHAETYLEQIAYNG